MKLIFNIIIYNEINSYNCFNWDKFPISGGIELKAL